MVTRGTGKNKREEQDGWNGKIIPNDLIAKILYCKELNNLDNKRNKVGELETQLADLVEDAKVKERKEYEALFEIIKRDKEDELGDTFDKTRLKSELKGTQKGSDKYTLLKKVDHLIADSAKLSKEIKNKEKELWDALEERILVLTDDEIDKLVSHKWFGKTVNNITELIDLSVKNELNTLQKLEDRYSDTLDEIDGQIESMLVSFDTLKDDLVVG